MKINHFTIYISLLLLVYSIQSAHIHEPDLDGNIVALIKSPKFQKYACLAYIMMRNHSNHHKSYCTFLDHVFSIRKNHILFDIMDLCITRHNVSIGFLLFRYQ